MLKGFQAEYAYRRNANHVLFVDLGWRALILRRADFSLLRVLPLHPWNETDESVIYRTMTPAALFVVSDGDRVGKVSSSHRIEVDMPIWASREKQHSFLRLSSAI